MADAEHLISAHPLMAKKLKPQQEPKVIPRWRSLIGYLLLPSSEVDHGVLVTDRRGRGSSWSGHASAESAQGISP
jgi:hypothetical protein